MTAHKNSPTRFYFATLIAVLSVVGTGYFYSTHVAAGPAGPAITAGHEEAISHASALSEAFRTAANQTLPAVVSIQNTSEPRLVRREARPQLPGQRLPPELDELDPLLKKFFGEMPEGIDPRGMPDMPQTSSGSGVIIDPAGVILTNNHVVAGGGKVTVRLHDGREFVATEVKTDPNTDIAVIKIKGDGALPSAALGNSDDLQIGDWVLALGQPFGLQDTVTAGIISAKHRAINITKHAEFLQTDAAINPGNSGGPLVNLRGEVIGINTAISSSSGGFQGVGFAVPVNVAKWVSEQLLKDGKVHRAYLGVGIQPVTQELADQLGMKVPGGAMVTEVFPDSPAAKAGLQPQDVIVEFANQPIQHSAQLHALAGRAAIGATQPVVVIRDGKRVSLSVQMREQPSSFGVRTRDAESPLSSEETQSFDALGLEVAPLTEEVARQLGMREAAGVVITAVADESIAARAGLEAGMVVVKAAGKPVKNVKDFQAATSGASLEKGVLLLVRTSAGSRFVVLRANS